MNIYHEGRSEPDEGQHAIAQVTMNRAEWREENVCEVVMRPHQFSWTTGLIDRTQKGKYRIKKRGKPKEKEAWDKALKISRRTLAGKGVEVVPNATFYHAVYVSPRWANGLKRIGKIGRHIFYKVPRKKNEGARL